MRPTQPVEIFGNVSKPFGTLAICSYSGKILRRSSQGNPSVERVLTQEGQQNIAILDPSKAISRKRCNIGGKLITNRKSHIMSFRLVPTNSVTLNVLERRNSPNLCVISPNSVDFGTNYVKVVEDTPILSASEV